VGRRWGASGSQVGRKWGAGGAQVGLKYYMRFLMYKLNNRVKMRRGWGSGKARVGLGGARVGPEWL
jgi:hypothetical protein